MLQKIDLEAKVFLSKQTFVSKTKVETEKKFHLYAWFGFNPKPSFFFSICWFLNLYRLNLSCLHNSSPSHWSYYCCLRHLPPLSSTPPSRHSCYIRHPSLPSCHSLRWHYPSPSFLPLLQSISLVINTSFSLHCFPHLHHYLHHLFAPLLYFLVSVVVPLLLSLSLSSSLAWQKLIYYVKRVDSSLRVVSELSLSLVNP